MRLSGAPSTNPVYSSWSEALAAAGNSAGELVFVDTQEKEIRRPWREVRHRARRMAAALIRRGIHAGERVAMVLPTGLELTDMVLGVMLAGAVPVPIPIPRRSARIEEYAANTVRVLHTTQSRLLVTLERLLPSLGLVLEKAREINTIDFESLQASWTREESEIHSAPDALGLIQLSSGATLHPNPIGLTQSALLAHAANYVAALQGEDPEPPSFVSWLPLFQDVGLSGALLPAIYAHSKLVLMTEDTFLTRPALWLRAISRHKATTSAAPVSSYAIAQRRIQDDQLTTVSLATWKNALVVAEPVSAEFSRKFAERFGQYGFQADALRPTYGTAEAAFALTMAPPQRPLRTRALEQEPGHLEVASVGVPLPGVVIEIRDPEGKPLNELQGGSVHVLAPSLMSSYVGDEATTSAVFKGPWLDTGDIGFVCEGELFLHGRAKDLIILDGVHRSPQEFEECLEQLAGIRMASSVAVGFFPEGAQQESLLVMVEQSQTPDPKLEEHIRELLKTRTGVEPHTVVLLERSSLPRTAGGILRRAEAVRRYLAGDLTAHPPKGALSAAIEGVRFGLARAAASWRTKRE